MRLPDTLAGTQASAAPRASGAGPTRAWYVVVLACAANKHLYTTMTHDVGYLLHRATSPLAGGYAQAHGLDRLVLTETYACRYTAAARVSRVRGWPVAERRRLIEAANPGWADLSAGWTEAPPEGGAPTVPKAPSAP